MKRFPFIAVLICLVVLLGVAEPLSAAGPKAEGKGSRTQRKTFSAPNAIVIPDNTTANPYPSTIKVSGFKKGKITDVDVRLRGLNHGFADDVDVLLVAPDGETALLMSDVGGSTSAASLTLTLDDAAATALPDNGPLVSGAFLPANYTPNPDAFPGAPAPGGTDLAVFNGSNPNGTWRLYVVDDAGADTGAFSGGWDLKITAKVKKDKKGKKH